MPTIERDKIAPSLRRYFLALKRNIAGRAPAKPAVMKALEVAAEPGGTFRGSLPSPLSVHAFTCKTEGIAGLMEGRLEALDLLYQSVYYDAAYLYCQGTHYMVNKEYGVTSTLIDFRQVALLLANALTLGCWAEADRIAEMARACLSETRIDRANDNQIAYAFYAIHVTRVAPFILSLYALWSEKPFPLEGLPLQPMQEYEILLSLWQTEDISVLEKVLLDACDAHVKQSKFTQVDVVEFERPVDILYPVEILAVLRLREATGLANPILDHPLMKTPVGRLYEIKSVPHEPVMDRVVEKQMLAIPSLCQTNSVATRK